MPELPDVEVFKQDVNSTSLRKKVRQVDVKDDAVLNVSAQTFRQQIESRSFEETQRTGKHLFLSTDSGIWLMLHFGMTGNVQYIKDGKDVPEHARVLFHFSGDEYLSYTSQRKLGSISVIENPSQFREEHKLGEDALEVSRDKFRQLLNKKKSMIKTALMDQSTIAGIGNVYSDEILYQCKIHPETKTNELSDDQIKELHRRMRRILKTSISNQADPAKMPRHYLISHRKKGADCPDCKGKVKHIKVSGRECYICPRCQSKRSN